MPEKANVATNLSWHFFETFLSQLKRFVLCIAAYGMGAYGGADARSLYGAGYPGQAVSAQASPYGVPGASVPASQYSGYGMFWDIQN